MTRHLAAAAALIALATSAGAEAAVQRCSLALGGGGQAMLRIDERGRTVNALAMDFTRPVGASAHECSLGARRGDGRSRWRADRTATYVSMTGAAGPFEAVVQRYKGDLQLGLSEPGGELATCGTFAVPGTVIVTPRPGGRCVARLPGQR